MSKPQEPSTMTTKKNIVWLTPECVNNGDHSSEPLASPPLVADQHIAYLLTLATSLSQPTSFEGAVTEHLRMSGIYWSWTALHLLLPVSSASVQSLLNEAIGGGDTGTSESSTSTSTTTGVCVSTPTPTGSTETTHSNSNSPMEIIDWVWSCFNEDEGSFGGNTDHPGHILYTLSAIQILVMADMEDYHKNNNTDESTKQNCFRLRLLTHCSAIYSYVVSLQQSDGSFVGDSSRAAEIDSRFTYCALSTCALIDAWRTKSSIPLDLKGSAPTNDTSTTTRSTGTATGTINIPSAVAYIVACRNLDGGFGSCIGAESHAGQVFCCVGALAIAESLHLLSTRDINLLSWWLCERQVDSGGLNGRPEKQADVCYSWWILSSLSILGRVSWINVDKLAHFVLHCQDDVDGGIADRPDDMADVFHTFFGIAGLSLLGHLHRARTTLETVGSANRLFRQIDPLYALPSEICQQLQLPGQVLGTNQSPSVDDRLLHYKVHHLQ